MNMSSCFLKVIKHSFQWRKVFYSKSNSDLFEMFLSWQEVENKCYCLMLLSLNNGVENSFEFIQCVLKRVCEPKHYFIQNVLELFHCYYTCIFMVYAHYINSWNPILTGCLMLSLQTLWRYVKLTVPFGTRRKC